MLSGKPGILKSVGLIYQRRKVHGALATDCLWLRKLQNMSCILPIVAGKNKQIQENSFFDRIGRMGFNRDVPYFLNHFGTTTSYLGS
jgi:hypothetical protein